MRISFVLGPAGTGKTFRCLSEIRSELLASPEGAPLIFLAPKQSTYQLERQLLEGGLPGYSRLHIVSFERFATFVFQRLGATVPNFLSEQGRTMVLRALLTRMEDELTIFRSAARRLGFAEEVSKQIREFQNHGLSVAKVRELAARLKPGHSAGEKLRDLALVYERYGAWLNEQKLEDGDALLTAATELLERTDSTAFEIGGLWFDGFAQLTPQELNFFVAALRFSRCSTLAFCVDAQADSQSRISAGHLVSKTLERCRAFIETRYGKEVIHADHLSRIPARSRFESSQPLQHLERCWHTGDAWPNETGGAIRMVQANDPEAEAIFAAREIVRHVRAGGRYRDAALLLRDLQNDYPHVLRRVFQRYEIPFFLDHRESVAHHPVAELTRGALRTIAYNWRHSDWFATLKCGLVHVCAEDLDELENEALARGWQGAVWKSGFAVPKNPAREQEFNRMRERLIKPFTTFATALGARPSAEMLARSLRDLWETLSVQEQLENWSHEDPAEAMHTTVWEQMEGWLRDLELAFAGQQMSLHEWLPILEAGLRGLTVGVVPPVLDQVLIGTVDRSRNPDLKILFVLGLNERVFPAAPARDMLLSEDDRDALCDTGCTMGETPAWRLAGEQFYGYIACTRPREQLLLTYSRASMDGAQLNPSRFISQVQRLFPELSIEKFSLPATVEDVLHASELAPLGIVSESSAARSPLLVPATDESLDASLAERLYGKQLAISVSSLERFAACPYKFFLEQGLRVRERKEFQLDVREQGSFQHDVLAKFHEELVREKLRWRDLTPDQASERVGRIADTLIEDFRDGLLASSEQNRFTAENYKLGLQELIRVLVGWLATNRFDPEVVEFGFGGKNALPPWRLELGEGRSVLLFGRVDRIDLLRLSKDEALCVVLDYKSGLKKPDKTLMHHGVQQQLPAYLLALTRMPEVAAHFGVKRVTPAGCFLLPLSARRGAKKSRREALDPATPKSDGYTHEGLFNVDFEEFFDSGAAAAKSGQFRYRLTKDGVPYKKDFTALDSASFESVLSRSAELIREFGTRIFQGEIAIHPYKRGKDIPCERCDYQSICRFDPWTQDYNVLRAPETTETAEETGQ